MYLLYSNIQEVIHTHKHSIPDDPETTGRCRHATKIYLKYSNITEGTDKHTKRLTELPHYTDTYRNINNVSETPKHNGM